MEKQFKKLIQKTKAWNQGVEPLAHTYAGALFKDTSWAFAFDDSISVEPMPAPVKDSPENLLKKASSPIKSDAESLVLFVGDTFKEGSGEDLLGKMIQAMKLKNSEFHRISFDEKLDEILDPVKNLTDPSPETKELLEKIIKFRPMVVVTLGATVTNILLGKREKLSGIHGQFFDKISQDAGRTYNYQLLPIFHPDFLIINPNMKRTAWIDLQKVMERVGKI